MMRLPVAHRLRIARKAWNAWVGDELYKMQALVKQRSPFGFVPNGSIVLPLTVAVIVSGRHMPSTRFFMNSPSGVFEDLVASMIQLASLCKKAP